MDGGDRGCDGGSEDGNKNGMHINAHQPVPTHTGPYHVVGWCILFDFSVYSWPSFNQERKQAMVGPGRL